MRHCPFDGCDKVISPEIFACRPHWFSLTKRLQSEVWAAYRAWQRGQIDGEELRRRQQAVLDEAQRGGKKCER